MIKRWGAAIALGLMLTGCTPLSALNAFVPRNYEKDEGLAFGTGARQQLDVYRPVGGPAGAKPVVIFLYGGRWQSGDRGDYRFAGEAFSASGYVVVVPDTPLYPGVKYPAFLEDAAQAVRWTVDHVAAHGGDPGRIFLVGHSSGAYNVAMLTLDERWLAGVGLSNHVLDGAVGLAGPYDFAPFEDADIQDLFGPPGGWPATQPIQYADGDDPPMLLLHGTDDDIVQPGNATRLAAKLTALGGHAEVKQYPGIDHYKIVVALGRPFRGLAPVLDDAVAFLKAH